MISDLKPYPTYKDSGVPWLGKVPEHWELRRGKWLFRHLKQTNADRTNSNVLSLTLRGVVNNNSDNPEGLVPKDYATYQHFGKGDLVFKLIDLENLKTSRVGLVHEDGIMSSAYVRLTLRSKGNIRFFFQQYFDLYQRGIYNQLGAGVRSTLGSSDLLELLIVVPPLLEQSAIVRFLDHVDRMIRRYIQAKQRELALIREMLSVVTDNALQLRGTKRLRLSTAVDVISRPVERCSDKRYTRIGLYNRGRGIFHKAATDGAELGESDFFWVEDGDLVISGQFAWEGAVGLARAKDSGCIASHRYPILRGREEYASSAVLFALFRTPYLSMLLDRHSRGAAGRNRPLNAPMLLKEIVSIPPISSQSSITGLLNQEYAVAQSLSDKVQFINEFRARLIADVVTGKLDVRKAAENLPDVIEGPKALEDVGTLSENDDEAVDGELDADREEAEI